MILNLFYYYSKFVNMILIYDLFRDSIIFFCNEMKTINPDNSKKFIN